MNPKFLSLTLLGLTLVSLAIYNYQKLAINAEPKNVDICSIVNYSLMFNNLKFAKDVVAGQDNNLDISFTPTNDGKIIAMIISAAQDDNEIYNFRIDRKTPFNDGKEVHFNTDLHVPSNVPAGTINVTLNFYDTDFNSLSCVKFDLTF